MSIVVQVERVLFFKDDSRWCILKTNPCATGDGESSAARGLVCKGVAPFDIKEGDRLKLEGYFKESKHSGNNEFDFRAAIPDLPVDLGALLHYAVSITKGLGEAREAQIWAKYGAEWITVERLEIDGLSEKAHFAWSDTLRKINESKAQTQAAAFLMSRGCTLNMATVAWNEWGENTIGTVNANFYDLAQLPHYGFKTVDENIRPYFDIEDSDPRRLSAAIMYVIGELGSNGDTLVSMDDLSIKVQDLVTINSTAINDELLKLSLAGKIVITDSKAIALASDYANEVAIFERFAQ